MLARKLFDFRQIHFQKPVKIASRYKQMQDTFARILDHLSDDTAFVVTEELKTAFIHAVNNVINRMRVATYRESLVEQLCETVMRFNRH